MIKINSVENSDWRWHYFFKDSLIKIVFFHSVEWQEGTSLPTSHWKITFLHKEFFFAIARLNCQRVSDLCQLRAMPKFQRIPSGNLTVCYWMWPLSSLIYRWNMDILQFVDHDHASSSRSISTLHFLTLPRIIIKLDVAFPLHAISYIRAMFAASDIRLAITWML